MKNLLKNTAKLKPKTYQKIILHDQLCFFHARYAGMIQHTKIMITLLEIPRIQYTSFHSVLMLLSLNIIDIHIWKTHRINFPIWKFIKAECGYKLVA